MHPGSARKHASFEGAIETLAPRWPLPPRASVSKISPCSLRTPPNQRHHWQNPRRTQSLDACRPSPPFHLFCPRPCHSTLRLDGDQAGLNRPSHRSPQPLASTVSRYPRQRQQVSLQLPPRPPCEHWRRPHWAGRIPPDPQPSETPRKGFRPRNAHRRTR
jgi:hypothetical protein